MKASLEKWDFIPDAIALLTTCPDFIHEHDGVFIFSMHIQWRQINEKG